MKVNSKFKNNKKGPRRPVWAAGFFQKEDD